MIVHTKDTPNINSQHGLTFQFHSIKNITLYAMPVTFQTKNITQTH